MSGRVFISCGQVTPAEKKVADAVKQWFHDNGFIPFVAIQAQSLADINSGIIDQLKQADFYVFVDFCRERLVPNGFINRFKQHPHRGSLFTNQELAIVFQLQFEQVIFLQQEGVKLEGLMRYMASNATQFNNLADVPSLVEHLVTERGWNPTYTRHLAVGESRWGPPVAYGDHTGQHRVRTFYVDVHNHRPDVGALDATARLERVVRADNTVTNNMDRSPLKATGQQGYAQVIWPQSYATWDCLSVSMENNCTVFLNSALDLVPRTPIISTAGEYVLTYEVFAQNFPVLRFNVELTVNDDPQRTFAALV